MVDLGKYFVPVMSAYAISLLGLAALIMISWLQARKTTALLNAAEARREARREAGKAKQNGV